MQDVVNLYGRNVTQELGLHNRYSLEWCATVFHSPTFEWYIINQQECDNSPLEPNNTIVTTSHDSPFRRTLRCHNGLSDVVLIQEATAIRISE